jgi:opacity protein-like surface antigen
MNRILKASAVILLAVSMPALAQDEVALDQKWYGGFGAGGFSPKDNSGILQEQSGQYTLSFQIGYRYSENISFELDTVAHDQRVDTPASITPPFLGTVDGRTHIYGGGFSGVVKFSVPLGHLVPYIGGGVGMYFATMNVTGTVLGLETSAEANETVPFEQVLAGADYWFSDRWALGIEYRRAFIEANFGGFTNGDVQLGGDSVLLTVKFSPRTP